MINDTRTMSGPLSLAKTTVFEKSLGSRGFSAASIPTHASTPWLSVLAASWRQIVLLQASGTHDRLTGGGISFRSSFILSIVVDEHATLPLPVALPEHVARLIATEPEDRRILTRQFDTTDSKVLFGTRLVFYSAIRASVDVIWYNAKQIRQQVQKQRGHLITNLRLVPIYREMPMHKSIVRTEQMTNNLQLLGDIYRTGKVTTIHGLRFRIGECGVAPTMDSGLDIRNSHQFNPRTGDVSVPSLSRQHCCYLFFASVTSQR